ncbi:MAG: deoxynucleoside kinase [Candidatus Peribacteria bacterium]|jgi:dTMP kinase|nr:deoxynucleoside kinase [Candidatus Peribacteria bacterium]
MKTKGNLIVIDGTDGSGKHTQTELLGTNLRALGCTVETISFPQYGKKSAGPTENYLNGLYGSAAEIDAYQASVLYAVDRFDASFQIRQWIAEGKIVITDRYVSANMGHQAGKIQNLSERDHYLAWIEHFEYEIMNIPRPDINIFLYVDPELARSLALQVGKVNMDKTKDIHENSAEHMRNASNAFKYVATKYGWITIDCTHSTQMKSREEIASEITKIVQQKLKL